MEDIDRILILHRDRAKAAAIVSALMHNRVFEIKCIHHAMESVPEYAAFQPHAFIVETGLIELPIPALAKAIRQMDPNAKLILCNDHADMKLKGESEAIGAQGFFDFPPDPETIFTLIDAEVGSLPPQSNGDADAEDPTDLTVVQGLNPFWRKRANEPETLTISAAELDEHEHYEHRGPLRVEGDIKKLRSLKVEGSLAVEGSVFGTRIHCHGPILIKDRLQDCTRGVFSRDVIDVRGIANSFVVASRNLWLGAYCLDSYVCVLQRMVGKREDATVSGGRLRVGEHLSIGTIGDSDHSYTRIEMAPELLRAPWTRAKQFQFHLLQAQNPKSASNKASLFEKQVRNPWFFRIQSELLANHIFPGVEICVGEDSDFIFQEIREATRVGLIHRKNKGFSVSILPKSKWQKKAKKMAAREH